MNDNLYALLGVDPEATQQDIKKAWRVLAKEHHPDKGGSPETLSKINAAYDILKDPQKRETYDMERQGRAGFTGGMDSMFEDLFAQMFQQQRRQPVLTMPVTIEDLCQGTQKKVTLKKANGTTEELSFFIPAGAAPGQTLRLKTTSSSILVRLNLQPHEHYTLQGENVLTKIRVPLIKAIEGGELSIQDPYGRKHTIPLKPGTQSGTYFEIPHAGLPTLLGNGSFYAIFHVETPTNLTKEQKDILKSICGQGNERTEKPTLWESIKETVGL